MNPDPLPARPHGRPSRTQAPGWRWGGPKASSRQFLLTKEAPGTGTWEAPHGDPQNERRKGNLRDEIRDTHDD